MNLATLFSNPRRRSDRALTCVLGNLDLTFLTLSKNEHAHHFCTRCAVLFILNHQRQQLGINRHDGKKEVEEAEAEI